MVVLGLVILDMVGVPSVLLLNMWWKKNSGKEGYLIMNLSREKKAAAHEQFKDATHVEPNPLRGGVKRWSSMMEIKPPLTNGNTTSKVSSIFFKKYR
jgi:hypothetical protein